MAVNKKFNEYIKEQAAKLGKDPKEIDIEQVVLDYLKSEGYTYDAFGQVQSTAKLPNGPVSVDQQITLRKMDYSKIAVDNNADKLSVSYAEVLDKINTEYIEILEQRKQLEKDKADLASSRQSFNQYQQGALDAANALQARFDAKDAELKAREAELSKKEAEYSALLAKKAELDEREAKLAELEKNGASNAELENAKKQLAELEKEKAKIDEEFTKLNSKYEAERESRKKAEEKLDKANENLKKANDEKETLEKDLVNSQKMKTKAEDLAKSRKKWNVGLGILSGLLTVGLVGAGLVHYDQAKKIDSLNADITGYKQTIFDKDKELADLNKTIEDMKDGNITIQAYNTTAVNFFKSALENGYITQNEFASFVSGDSDENYAVNFNALFANDGELYSLLMDSAITEEKLSQIEVGLGTTLSIFGLQDENGEPLTIDDYTYQNYTVNGYTYDVYVDSVGLVGDLNDATNEIISTLTNGNSTFVEMDESVITLKQATDAIVDKLGALAEDYNELVAEKDALDASLSEAVERVTTAEAERDQAVADKETAESERDQAIADKETAEDERDQALEENEELKDAINGGISGGVTGDQEINSGGTGPENVGDGSTEEESDLTIEGESGGATNTGDGNSSSSGKKPGGTTTENENSK